MRYALFVMLVLSLIVGCDNDKPDPAPVKPANGGTKTDKGEVTLILYSGRKLSLVEPVIAEFTKQTSIKVEVKEGKSSAMAMELYEEGVKSPADLFWAQDAGSLGDVAKAGLFEKAPDAVMNLLPEKHRTSSGLWVAVSGRARVLAYAPAKVSSEELPKSIFDLTDPKWKGRIAWAPRNSSFQAFVTAMRIAHGEEKTKKWLIDMKANEPVVKPKNTPIIHGLASGEIALGLPNHYYLLREKAKDAKYPVEQTFFADGDIGNLVNVAGVAIMKTSENKEAAAKFVEFLLSDWAQSYFTNTVFEYPLIESVKTNENLVPHDKLQAALPEVKLSDLDDLAGTLKLLKETGLAE
jgi:iron(III) transport system substrate-binding protein